MACKHGASVLPPAIKHETDWANVVRKGNVMASDRQDEQSTLGQLHGAGVMHCASCASHQTECLSCVCSGEAHCKESELLCFSTWLSIPTVHVTVQPAMVEPFKASFQETRFGSYTCCVKHTIHVIV